MCHSEFLCHPVPRNSKQLKHVIPSTVEGRRAASWFVVRPVFALRATPGMQAHHDTLPMLVMAGSGSILYNNKKTIANLSFSAYS